MNKVAAVPVFHYLYENAIGKTEAERLNNSTVTLTLPDKIGGYEKRYKLHVDSREKRTLVVFDGDILFGGIPKAGNIVFSEFLGRLSLQASHLRKTHPKEQAVPYEIGGDGATLDLERFFLLLPAGRATVRRYRPKSLSPQYTMIEVKIQNSRPLVSWFNSSY